jgi:predicted nucleotide-binding protein
MKVFWSWQSDLPPSVSKKFVQDALSEALDKVALDLELSPAERPELDHDTKGEAGLVEIVNTILQKIDSATVFVADVTPIAVTAEGKKVPNPNVMIELGHALKSLGHAAIVLVANTEFGGKPEDLPFDLRMTRKPSSLQKRDS